MIVESIGRNESNSENVSKRKGARAKGSLSVRARARARMIMRLSG